MICLEPISRAPRGPAVRTYKRSGSKGRPYHKGLKDRALLPVEGEGQRRRAVWGPGRGKRGPHYETREVRWDWRGRLVAATGQKRESGDGVARYIWGRFVHPPTAG